MDKSNTFRAGMAFVLGGLAGAGIALLFAPQTGKRTREDVRCWGRMLKIKSAKAPVTT